MQLLNESQAAKLLGCSIHKLQKDRRIGSLIPYRKIGRSIRYLLSDIESYIEKQKFTSTAEYRSETHALEKSKFDNNGGAQ